MIPIVVLSVFGLALVAVVYLIRRRDVRVVAVAILLGVLAFLSDMSLRNAARAVAIPDSWLTMTAEDKAAYRRGADAVQNGINNVRPLLDITGLALAIIALLPSSRRERRTPTTRAKNDRDLVHCDSAGETRPNDLT
jgi:hypothetical protein